MERRHLGSVFEHGRMWTLIDADVMTPSSTEVTVDIDVAF